MQHHVTRSGHSRPRIVARLVAGFAALAIVVGLGASASAGGWALGSLDALPDARAGETQQVGFMILQHGVTPASVGGDVGVEIVGSDGEVTFFGAVPEGGVGHYVATITFPEAGDYRWNIRMGWFSLQDLGSLSVAPSASSGGGFMWSAARWGLLGLAAVLAAFAVMNLASERRRTAAIPS